MGSCFQNLHAQAVFNSHTLNGSSRKNGYLEKNMRSFMGMGVAIDSSNNIPSNAKPTRDNLQFMSTM